MPTSGQQRIVCPYHAWDLPTLTVGHSGPVPHFDVVLVGKPFQTSANGATDAAAMPLRPHEGDILNYFKMPIVNVHRRRTEQQSEARRDHKAYGFRTRQELHLEIGYDCLGDIFVTANRAYEFE